MFSVVIPLYNKRPTIERAIRSVLRQGAHTIEIIVVDDGSTDDGAIIASSMGDPRIRVIAQANGGAAAARNRGVKESRYDLVAFLDADDEWQEGFLDAISALIRRYPSVGAYATGYQMKTREGRIIAPSYYGIPKGFKGELENYFRACFSWSPLSSSGTVVKKSVFEALGGFKSGKKRGEDLDLWIRFALSGPVAFDETRKAIYYLDAANRSDGPASEDRRSDWWFLKELDRLTLDHSIPARYRRWLKEMAANCRVTVALDSSRGNFIRFLLDSHDVITSKAFWRYGIIMAIKKALLSK